MQTYQNKIWIFDDIIDKKFQDEIENGLPWKKIKERLIKNYL